MVARPAIVSFSCPIGSLTAFAADGVQLLLGHTKLESALRYRGIEVDDALEIAEQTEV
jgi:hypothetical protein